MENFNYQNSESLLTKNYHRNYTHEILCYIGKNVAKCYIIQVLLKLQYFDCYLSWNSNILNVENFKSKCHFINDKLSQGTPSFWVFKFHLSKCEKKHLTLPFVWKYVVWTNKTNLNNGPLLVSFNYQEVEFSFFSWSMDPL